MKKICIDCKHYEVPHTEEPCNSCTKHYAATGEDHIYFEEMRKGMFRIKNSLGNMGSLIDENKLIGRDIRMKINGEWVNIGTIVEVNLEGNYFIGEIKDEYKEKLFSEQLCTMEFKMPVESV